MQNKARPFLQDPCYYFALPVQCKMFIVHSTLYSVQCTLELLFLFGTTYTLYIVHCTLYILQCTLYIVHCTLYIVQCTIELLLLFCTTYQCPNAKGWALYSAVYIVCLGPLVRSSMFCKEFLGLQRHSVNCTVYSLQSKVHSAQCTVYRAQCTVYS